MNETRIKAAQRIDAALEDVNKPLLTLLLRLINTSTLPTVKGGAAVKTLHSYADELLDFYINECFDGDAVKRGRCDMLETADELSARSNGFARLLAYLGADEDAKSLTEYAKTLVDAYYEADDILTSESDECFANGECECDDDCDCKESDSRCACCDSCDKDCDDCDCCPDRDDELDDEDDECEDDEADKTSDSHCDNDECEYFDDCECRRNGPRCRTCDDCIYCGECICCPDRNSKDNESDEDADKICPRKVKCGDAKDKAPGVRKPIDKDLEGVYRLFCEVFGLNPDAPKKPEKKPEPKKTSDEAASEEKVKLSDAAVKKVIANILVDALLTDMLIHTTPIYQPRRIPLRRAFPDFWPFFED